MAPMADGRAPREEGEGTVRSHDGDWDGVRVGSHVEIEGRREVDFGAADGGGAVAGSSVGLAGPPSRNDDIDLLQCGHPSRSRLSALSVKSWR